MNNQPNIEEIVNSWVELPTKDRKDLDAKLLEKAKHFNLTARQVKSLIFNVCSDKSVVDFAIHAAGVEETGAVEGFSVDNVRLTRNRLRALGFGDEKPKTFDQSFELNYDEENDPDYCPSVSDSPLRKRKIPSPILSPIEETVLNISHRTRSQLPMKEANLELLDGLKVFQTLILQF